MSDSTYPPTPELDKMRKVADISRAQGDFINFLQEDREIVLCRYDEGGQLWSICDRIEDLLAEYHDIDLKKCEAERVSILEFIRQQDQNRQV